MKVKRFILVFPLVAALLCSCYSEIENELDLIERRVSELEKSLSTIQINITSLKTLVSILESRDFVTKVVDDYGDDGEIESYTIYFSNSEPVTIFHGKDAGTPVIGVRMLEDGHYYWTIKYPDSTSFELILDASKNPVMASAVTPQVMIDEKGNWNVSYDDGENWEFLGKATGDTPESFIQSVVDSVDYYLFVDTEGNEVRVPSWASFETLMTECETANRNYSELDSLRMVINAKNYAKDIVPIMSGTDTIGYKLCFADNTELSFYNGLATNRPVLSAQRDTAAVALDSTSFFWTVKFAGSDTFEWVIVNGEKVRADASPVAQPTMGIELDEEDGLYYWTVSYDGGEPIFIMDGENRVRASAAENARVVDSISVNKSVISIKVGDVVYTVPRFNDFEVKFSPISDRTISMSAGSTTWFICSITNGDADYTVLPIAYDGFYVTTSTEDYKSWIINITSPTQFTESRMDLLISDGKGTMKSFEFTIKKD